MDWYKGEHIEAVTLGAWRVEGLLPWPAEADLRALEIIVCAKKHAPADTATNDVLRVLVTEWKRGADYQFLWKAADMLRLAAAADGADDAE